MKVGRLFFVFYEHVETHKKKSARTVHTLFHFVYKMAGRRKKCCKFNNFLTLFWGLFWKSFKWKRFIIPWICVRKCIFFLIENSKKLPTDMVHRFLIGVFIVIVMQVMYNVASFMRGHVVRYRVADRLVHIKRDVIGWIVYVVSAV